MINKSKQNRGVTFIELIIAVSVLSIGILGLYLVIIFGIGVNREAKYLALSYEIANREIETVRNTSFTDLVNQTDGNFYSGNADISKLPSGSGTLTIENYEGNDKIKEIIVKVTWQEQNTTKTTTVTTLATEGGINQ
jgi:prepilin-type N-terminal cleavage/methylation domain-containing protein